MYSPKIALLLVFVAKFLPHRFRTQALSGSETVSREIHSQDLKVLGVHQSRRTATEGRAASEQFCITIPKYLFVFPV